MAARTGRGGAAVRLCAAAPEPAPAATAPPALTPVPVPASPAAPAPTVREMKAPVEVTVKGPEPGTLENAARNFFAYFDRVRQMSSSELGREFTRLDPPTSPAAVLELALALGQTRNPSDTVRALGLLDPLVRNTDPQYAPWQPLARLLSARYVEQRRLEDQLERQSQQLRDAQRRQEQLAQQLEALKAIERSLNNRPAAPAAGPASRPVPSP